MATGNSRRSRLRARRAACEELRNAPVQVGRLTPEQCDRVTLLACGNAVDKADARDLMEVLGLITPVDKPFPISAVYEGDDDA